MPFRTVQSFPNRFLVQYYRQLEQQQRDLDHLRRALPPVLARHALHCVIDKNKLLLYTDAAAWASQLRFYKSAILAEMARLHGPSVDSLQIRLVTEKAGLKVNSSTKPHVPSAEHIAMIRKQSDHVSDIELKRSLQKLCATLSGR